MFIVKFYKNLISTSTLYTYSGVYEAKMSCELSVISSVDWHKHYGTLKCYHMSLAYQYFC